MSRLVDQLSAALTSSPHDLHVLNADHETWTPHSWGEVHARAQNFAEAVHDHGPAQAVALIGEPSIELLSAIFGSWLAGASVALLPGPVRGADPGQWAEATLSRCQNIGATAVYSHGDRLADLQSRDDQRCVHDVSPLAHAQRSTTLSAVGTDRPAILQGTAGSTGTPKTAQLSHDAVLANISGISERVGIDRGTDSGLSWLPLYHDMGLTFLLTTALSGLPSYQAPTSAFSAMPFRWLGWLAHSRATLTAAPNFAYNVLGKYASRLPDCDLSSIRFALNGGEPVDCAGMARFATEMQRFGFDGGALSPAYGMAESTCAVSVTPPGNGLQFDEVRVTTDDGEMLRRHAVLGNAISGMEIRIEPVDFPVAEAAGRDVGEVQVRGDSMMSGYLGDTPCDPGNWFGTGDLGYFTDDGLVVCGRVKELIHIAGRNVFPSEIERIAGQVPGVREGSVVAVGSDEQSARPGLVIAAEFRGGDEEETRVTLVRKVASECGVVPAKVLFVEPGTLPRTSSGKLRRLEVQRTLVADRG
ncbi:long-chain-fatty-acid--ACP ligase [Mycolicibacterium chitae]|uniref:AMP-dependent synthetase and ligase n=1 Tax=Mycolicibacterium chitae TaxID=1792 RepID=A0A3S4SC40_MYCCI|nr:long-chain-fatty acid--ACP ligase MbtM [Mycolicibacterium chitae]MCV7109269.1 long-chain-fatty acid--ACP ligase MbtM [Mycolicibacterium chitae]BBZ00949.1 long-chain-fatty-acid--ACP ligase [Mycolicibacterium chitae]VEG49796.1 AMP-dependent synthetase and ligase [Mycolicibacterium chitae]